MIAIAAMAKNRVIGKDNKLPWQHSKEDFAFFRERTLDKDMIVGRTTFEHLPILKKRMANVLTSDWKYEVPENKRENARPMYLPVLKSALEKYPDVWKQENVVCIGGAKTYEICLPYISSFFVTEWQFDAEGDVIMPPFEHCFPVRRKIKEIEDGAGIIYEYMTGDKFMEEYPGTTVEFP